MLNLLRKIFYFFSPFVNSFERRVDRFLRNIKSTSGILTVNAELLALMQEDLVELSVWAERKYKGYRYMKKRVRRKMYANRDLILRKFQEFCVTYVPDEKEEKLRYLRQMAAFLRPGGIYEYLDAASFGKLLMDQEGKKMIGDCNQIVTFYIYLYSLKFPIQDLQIKILPEHVCLHFQSMDIECTSGDFVKYEEGEVLPVTEIVSTNLLDMSDFRERTEKISPRDMVKAAQLAYSISSMKEVVEKNLQISYHNLAVDCLNSEDFEGAMFFADKKGDEELRQAVYAKKYNNLVRKVANVKTVDDARRYKQVYRDMLNLARKMGDADRERGMKEILEELG